MVFLAISTYVWAPISWVTSLPKNNDLGCSSSSLKACELYFASGIDILYPGRTNLLLS